MSTYLELQQRIANDYLNRSTFTSEVKRSILAAVRFYERRRWRFNETATSIATVASTTFAALPANLLVPLEPYQITQNGSVIPLIEDTLEEVLAMRANATTGPPTHYAIFGNKIEFAVTPDSAYSTTMYYIKSLTELSADSDTNSWTTGAMQDLIVYHATKLMYSGVLRNTVEAAKFANLEGAILAEVSSEREQFFHTRLKPTVF